MSFLARKERGFTLIELLVVIAIIGLLASVVLASLNSAREKARNAARISDITQYTIALELYLDQNGEYPTATVPGPANFNCLGDYDDDECDKNNSVPEDSDLNNSLDDFIPGLPAVTELAADSREGYIYRVRNSGQGYQIQFYLEGTDQNCGPAIQYSDDVQGGTRCRLCAGANVGNGFCTPPS